MSDTKTEILYEQLKSIRGITKQLINKALSTNKNDMIKTISTISKITGLKIRSNLGNNIKLKLTSSSSSEESDNSENESGECECGHCSDNTIDKVKSLRKNSAFLKIRDNVIKQEQFEEINLCIENIAPTKILEAMVKHPKLALQILSDVNISD